MTIATEQPGSSLPTWGAGITAALLLSPLLVLLGIAGIAASASSDTCAADPAPGGSPTHLTAVVDGYSGVQLSNARAIIAASTSLRLPAQAQAIGVMTAMGESGLRILDYGDAAGPDSRGLFQQRADWGTLAQRMDPTESSILFFTALEQVPGWQLMTPTLAAHAVQGNADPDYYQQYYPAAEAVVAALSGATPGCTASHAIGDDYPWPNGTVNTLSPLGYDYRECVDFVAWRLNRDAGTTHAPWKWTWSTLTPLGGDAIEWRANWAANGWTVSSTPIVGAVAWWGTAAGPEGHVAYVQDVNANGTITIEEYNWGGQHSYDQRTIPATDPGAYLYPPS